MRHRTQDTYSLSHFRQHTTDHLDRLADGRVETITQNGEAAMVVMSPEVYDSMRIELERGQLWDQAIARFDAGERGVDAREAIDQVAARLNLKL
ncbi:MAG: type II toxin-antitoxin system Phd/YefM family antitoxin [Acidobacteriota bacterium]